MSLSLCEYLQSLKINGPEAIADGRVEVNGEIVKEDFQFDLRKDYTIRVQMEHPITFITVTIPM